MCTIGDNKNIASNGADHMKIATVTYRTHTLLTGLTAQAFDREVKPGNLSNAISNYKANGGITAHTVKLYRDGDIKDGYHHLIACCTMNPCDREIQVEIYD